MNPVPLQPMMFPAGGGYQLPPVLPQLQSPQPLPIMYSPYGSLLPQQLPTQPRPITAAGQLSPLQPIATSQMSPGYYQHGYYDPRLIPQVLTVTYSFTYFLTNSCKT